MGFEKWNWRGDQPPVGEDEPTSGLMTFTPAESKRLIAKAVVAMPEVKRALEKGRVIVTTTSTCAFIAEEILGKPVPREFYIKGNITYGMMCSTNRSDQWIKPYVFVNGSPVDREFTDVLPEFEVGDVFIKGANAVDPQGMAGILMASPIGGTIASALGIVTARGCHLVVPVGLEKLIPSVAAATRKCGIKRLRYPDGGTVGLMPLVGATVVTEIEALRTLAGVEATHVSSGGIGGSEGSVTLVVEGLDRRVQAAFTLWESIKGEPNTEASPITLRYGVDGRTGR